MVDASLPMIITDNSRGKAHGGIHPPLTIPRDSSFFQTTLWWLLTGKETIIKKIKIKKIKKIKKKPVRAYTCFWHIWTPNKMEQIRKDPNRLITTTPLFSFEKNKIFAFVKPKRNLTSLVVWILATPKSRFITNNKTKETGIYIEKKKKKKKKKKQQLPIIKLLHNHKWTELTKVSCRPKWRWQSKYAQ